MADIYEDQIRQRILNDLNAIDEAEHTLNAIVNPRDNYIPNHGTGNRGALLDMLDLLGIKGEDINDGEDILEQFKEILHRHNFTYTVVRLEDKWWHTSNGHMLGISASDGEFTPIKAKKFGFYFPSKLKDNKLVRVNSRNCSELKDAAYCFFRFLPPRKISVSEFMAFSAKGISSAKAKFVLMLVLVLALLNMLVPYATKLIFEDIILAGDSLGILPVLIVLLCVGVSIGVFSYLRDIITYGLKIGFSVASQAALVDRVFHLKTSFYKERTTGDVSDSVMAVSKASEFLSAHLISSIFTLVISVSFFVQIGIYSHFSLLTFIIYVLVLADFAVIYLGFRYKSRIKTEKAVERGKLFGLMYNFFTGIQKIKTNGAEARVYRMWAKHYSRTEPLTLTDTILGELPIVIDVLCILTIVELYSLSGMSVSDFAAFNAAMVGALMAVKQISPYVNEMSGVVPSLSRMKTILEQEPEKEENDKIVRNLSGNITISGLRFRYNSSMPYIFENLNLNVKQGEYVAIVGPSGSGKSTLIRLLLGLETPEYGSVFYDQHNVAHVNKSSLRRHIGTCMQEGRLFSGTILENIRISNPNATEEEVWEAARIASIDEDIKAMSNGMYHELDAQGSGLSGGQRQRILIARAVLNHPSVLLLDEATSSLDNISQNRVIENLDKINCTRVTIAHRLSTIRNCDRIIVLGNGRVEEQGTFDELMAKDGLFRQIANRQKL